MRVAVIPERLGGGLSPCGSIRLAAFFDFMRGMPDLKWDIRYLILEELEQFCPDVIVWQRVSLPKLAQVELVASYAKRTGALMVYELDDNLLELEDPGERKAYADKLKAVERSLAAADLVWCSTSNLQERVSGLTRNPPQHLPNALDPVLWCNPQAQVAGGGAFRILYMGTRTHAADLQLLLGAMDILQRKFPDRFRLSIIGVADHYPQQSWLEVIEPPAYIGSSYGAFVYWLQQQSGFHLGVAPLLNSRFNECKSGIKVLDYAALGLPSLVSDVAAYADFVADVDCFKVENRAESWAESIAEVLFDGSRTRRVSSRAKSLVCERVFSAAALSRVESIGSGLKKICS